MLHGVVMDVFDMPMQIMIVAYQMLPVATLPDTALATSDAPLASPFLFGQATREPRFDLRPTIRIVVIASRQTPDAMQMIGQHHNGHDLERTNRLRRAKRRTQIIHALHEPPTMTLQKIHGEEIGATRHTHAAIVRHTPASRRLRTSAIGKIRMRRSEKPYAPSHPTRFWLRNRRAGARPTSPQRNRVGRAQARLTS